ncbi:MAG: hypothetical protein LUD12_10070 [Lachnospiraceae bacterium]|nr:hypothetical protein [Lachnospiraceae bacterium]
MQKLKFHLQNGRLMLEYRRKGKFQSDKQESNVKQERVKGMATKNQEMEALKKIKEIVADLGKDSYLAIAFEGCFEDAEDNIGNDFGCSMKQRFESAQKEADHFRELAGKLTDERDAAVNEVKTLKSQVLDLKDAISIHDLLQNEVASLKLEAEDEALVIVEFAEMPESDGFKQAVQKHRELMRKAEYYQGIVNRVSKAASR